MELASLFSQAGRKRAHRTRCQSSLNRDDGIGSYILHLRVPTAVETGGGQVARFQLTQSRREILRRQIAGQGLGDPWHIGVSRKNPRALLEHWFEAECLEWDHA